MDMESLVGKTVDEISVSEDKDLIAFQCNATKEVFLFSAYRDCCSKTWIEEVTFDSGFLPAEIDSVKEEEGGSVDHPEHDHLQTYYIRLKSKKDYGNTALITFKNSSNGYYGGSLEKYEGDYNEEKMKKVK